MEQVKLLSMTGLLTVLIWASADSMVNETASVRLSFMLLPPAGNSTMIIEPDPDTPLFELEFSGPRRVIDTLQSQAPLRVRMRIPDRPTGPSVLQLERNALKQVLAEQWQEFRKLTLGAIEPSSISLNVDHYVTREVQVVPRPLQLTYDVEPQLERPTVIVRMRESFFRTLPEGQPLQLDVGQDIEGVLRDSPVGRTVRFTLPLDARRFGPDASFTPSAIDVTATVQAQRVTVQISTVPVLVAASFANLDKPLQAVTRDGSPLSLVTQTVTVSGLREDVARLQRGETRIYGIIQLKQEDFETLGALKLVTPDYQLPPGIRLAAEPQPIEFKLANLNEAGK